MSINMPGSSNAPLIQIPGYVFAAVCPIVVGIRFASRIRFNNDLGGDDWTILAALIFSFGDTAVLLAACHYGFGQHVKTLTPENKAMALRFFYISQILYKISINLTKISILLLFLRLFIQKLFRTLCWILIGIITCYMIATTFSTIFQCTPVPRAWNKAIPGTCINITHFWYANASFSIATDGIILLMPMPIIYSLRLPTNQKLALMFVFAMGTFVIVTSVLRMTTLSFSSTSPDSTYNIDSTSWTVIECNVAIICACLPMFRVLLTRLLPTLFPSSTNRSPHPPGRFSYAGKGTNEWTPSHSGKGYAHEIHMADVSTGRPRAVESEEYILQGTNAIREREGTPSSLRKDELHKVVNGVGIKLTTTYGIKYDDEESMLESAEVHGRRVSIEAGSTSH